MHHMPVLHTSSSQTQQGTNGVSSASVPALLVTCSITPVYTSQNTALQSFTAYEDTSSITGDQSGLKLT